MDKKRGAEMFLVLQRWGFSTVPPHTIQKKKKSLQVLSKERLKSDKVSA